MNEYVLVVYGNAFGTIATALLSLLLESIVGALLIFAGSYAILWGKHKEKDKKIVVNTNTDQQGVDGSNSPKYNMEEQDERARGRSKRETVIEESKPYILCIFANVLYAGYNIINKVALNQGMSQFVLVVYGNTLGTLATALLALTFERKNDSKISSLVLRDIFFLGLGSAIGRTLFLTGLKDSSPTFASATNNIIPSVTFILAVVFRMEKLDITKYGTQAKVGGTIVALAGATLMTLYKGITVISMHNREPHKISASKVSSDKDWIKDSVLLLVSYFPISAVYILQTKTIKLYPAPITLTSLICLSATILSTLLTAIVDHKASSWRLSCNSTLVAPIYSGIMIFGISLYVQTVVIQIKGPVFMTAFRPLSTILVAIMGILILGEALHLGSVIGAVLIVVGLYAVLWGKEKEREKTVVDNSMFQQAGVDDIKVVK
ncbi:hypothetical protein FNV43_RR14751 [Rhamnella rubrinervis]|uniref:EamA domain-containing protein n=1 Tax=Rhamnella rubrinervis TaxID=2594499 RepID=A0A8K0MGQ7_9ROSA|nr:hypothetical protein FNV43_RR14751 [Rhamnella rubrinervis]